MARRIDIDVSPAISQTGRPVKADISVPRDEDLSIILTGVPFGAVLRFALATTPGGAPIYRCRGTGSVINVEARDIGREEAVKEGQPYHFSISIIDPSNEGPGAELANLFLAGGGFVQTPTINPNVELFDDSLVAGATLPLQRLTQAEFNALPSKDIGRPYLIIDQTAVGNYLIDGTYRIVAVYLGTSQRYPAPNNAPTPFLIPSTVSNQILTEGGLPFVVDFGASSIGIAGAEWTATGDGASITQAGVLTVTPNVIHENSPVTATASRDGYSSTVQFLVAVVQTAPPPAPLLPDTLPDLTLFQGAEPYTRDVGVLSTNIENAEWSVSGPLVSISTDGIVTIPLDTLQDAFTVTATATVAGQSDSVSWQVVIVPFVHTIDVTQQPTEQGLGGLTTAMTAADVLAAWTGQPLGEASNQELVTYIHKVLIDGIEVAAADPLRTTENLTIETTMTAPNGDEPPLEATTRTLPVSVVAAGGQATITGTGAALRDPVIAGTPLVYERSVATPGTFTASNGSTVRTDDVQIWLKGALQTDLNRLSEVGDNVQARSVVSATGAASTVIPGPIRVAIEATITITEEATVGPIYVGMNEAQAVGAVTSLGISKASNGRPVDIVASAKRNNAAFAGTTVQTGDVVTITIARTAISAAPKPSTFTITAQASGGTIGLPATGPYTKAQVESLRTDGSTRGIPAGTTLKNGATATLPAGMSRSGDVITVAESADIASLDAWDFTGFRWIIRGRIRNFTRNLIRYDGDLTTGVVDLYPTATLDFVDQCTFLGAGYGDGFSKATCIYGRRTDTTTARINLMDRCDFYGWGEDIIKSSWPGVIRRCYMDTPVNLPKGTGIWSASTNYAVGAYVLNSNKQYAYRALTAGSGKALPMAKNSNANWQNWDPHSDAINPLAQYGARLLIEGVYINRLEGTRAIHRGSIRTVGSAPNNVVRATRNSNDFPPMGTVEIANIISTKSDINEAFPISLPDLSIPNTEVAIVRDSWIGTTGGGSFVHPGNAPGHVISNLVDYPNPTGLSAAYGEIGTPTTGGGAGGGSTTPDPVVVDTTVPAMVFSWAQSEPAVVTKSNYAASVEDTKQELASNNFEYFHYNGVAATPGPVIRGNTKATMSPGMIRLANALNYAVPGKKFVMAVANEVGLSRTSLFSDSGYPSAAQDRQWSSTQAVVDACLAAYPGRNFDRMTEFWYAADIAGIGGSGGMLANFAPLYYRQTAAGAAVPLGTIVGYRNQPLDHCLFDFNVSSGTGLGMLPKIPLDISQKGLWSSDFDNGRSPYTFLQQFVTDARFKQLGGTYGFPAIGWHGSPTDSAHPDKLVKTGYAQAAFDFYMPSLLRAAGFNIQPPRFIGVFTASDGSYAEVTFHRPNGGVLSTDFRVRGGARNTASPFYQDVWGFEIERAAGGGRYAIVNASATSVDAKYRGAVTRLNDGKVKIVMQQPLQAGDKISYLNGHAAWRSDYPATSPTGNTLYQMTAIEHVARFTDPNSDFPFCGFRASTISPVWTLVRGSYVGEGTPSGGSTEITPPAPGAPVKTADPSISGIPLEGQTLTATSGTYSNNPTITRQWQKNGVNISGATGTTYLVPGVVAGDQFRIVETASNGTLPNATGTSNVLTVSAQGTSSFTTVSNGPQFESAEFTTDNTTKIRYRGEVSANAGSLTTTTAGTLLRINGGACDFIFIVYPQFNSCRFDVETIRDSANTSVGPSSNRNFADMPLVQFNTFDILVDFPARLITLSFNGGTAQTKTLATNTGKVLIGRKVDFNGRVSTASNYVAPGIKIKKLECIATTNGVDSTLMLIQGSAATVNASPRKVAGSGNAT